MFTGENSVGRMTIEVRILENVLQVSEMLKTEARLQNTRPTFLVQSALLGWLGG